MVHSIPTPYNFSIHIIHSAVIKGITFQPIPTIQMNQYDHVCSTDVQEHMNYAAFEINDGDMIIVIGHIWNGHINY
jgi:hypothetical protein